MDDTKVREAVEKRAAKIKAISLLADWLAANPAVPVPNLDFHRHLNNLDGTEAENLATVRSIAADLGVGTDEALDDRTALRYRVGEHVWYELYAWHKGGRDIGELERLRARVAELEADRTGLAYTRADDDAVDPTSTGPREPLHTGGMTEGGILVDETPGLIVGDTADEQRDNAYAAYERDEAECPSAWHVNQGDKRSRCPICNEAD